MRIDINLDRIKQELTRELVNCADAVEALKASGQIVELCSFQIYQSFRVLFKFLDRFDWEFKDHITCGEDEHIFYYASTETSMIFVLDPSYYLISLYASCVENSHLSTGFINRYPCPDEKESIELVLSILNRYVLKGKAIAVVVPEKDRFGDDDFIVHVFSTDGKGGNE